MREFKCKGCHTYESSNNENIEGPAICNHVPFVTDHYCPCQTCVVKSMCLDSCEPYVEYIQWIIKHHRHMLDEHTIEIFGRWLKDVWQRDM